MLLLEYGADPYGTATGTVPQGYYARACEHCRAIIGTDIPSPAVSCTMKTHVYFEWLPCAMKNIPSNISIDP